MINPTPTEIEELMRFRLVGFNCRRYDNHKRKIAQAKSVYEIGRILKQARLDQE